MRRGKEGITVVSDVHEYFLKVVSKWEGQPQTGSNGSYYVPSYSY